MKQPLGVLLASDDPSWTITAGEAVRAAGHLGVGECPDAVSLLAHGALGIADVVLVDPGLLDVDRHVINRLRRHDHVVAAVGDDARGAPVAPLFATFEKALAWAMDPIARYRGSGRRRGDLVAVFGCKGAPGATRMAIDLAQRIAQRVPVTLMDLDPRGGDVATYLDLPAYPNVVGAANAVGHGLTWQSTRIGRRLTVLSAPSRRGWANEVVPADLGLLLDNVGACVIDGGSVEAEVEEMLRHGVVRAGSVIVLGGSREVNRGHLARAHALLEAMVPDVRVVIGGRGLVAEEIAATVVSCAEQERQAR